MLQEKVFVLEIMQVTFVRVLIVDSQTSAQLSAWDGLAQAEASNVYTSENEQCYEAHAYSVSAVGIYY